MTNQCFRENCYYNHVKINNVCNCNKNWIKKKKTYVWYLLLPKSNNYKQQIQINLEFKIKLTEKLK